MPCDFTKIRIAAAVLTFTTLLIGSGDALAHLADTPPKGVALDGKWAIDAGKRDDAETAVNKARDNITSARLNGASSGAGGFPGGGGHRGGMRGGMGGMGGGRHSHRDTSSEDASAEQKSGQDDSGNRPSHSHEDILTGLDKNPETIVVTKDDAALKISTESTGFESDAGGKSSIEDELGDAERTCGWDGRAWVVETNQGRAGMRSDRYEVSKCGKTLTYTTQVSGGRFRKVRLTRVYLAEPRPVVPAGAPSR
jgi:hypothetical protein